MWSVVAVVAATVMAVGGEGVASRAGGIADAGDPVVLLVSRLRFLLAEAADVNVVAADVDKIVECADNVDGERRNTGDADAIVVVDGDRSWTWDANLPTGSTRTGDGVIYCGRREWGNECVTCAIAWCQWNAVARSHVRCTISGGDLLLKRQHQQAQQQTTALALLLLVCVVSGCCRPLLCRRVWCGRWGLLFSFLLFVWAHGSKRTRPGAADRWTIDRSIGQCCAGDGPSVRRLI